jgi:hypothetical protein
MLSEKPYNLPDPKTQPDRFLVLFYKTLKRVPYDDRAWDRQFFPRAMKRIQELLAVFDGDAAMTGRCMKALADHFYELGLTFTLETLISHAYEWRAEQDHVNHKRTMENLLAAYRQPEDRGGLERMNPVKMLEKLLCQSQNKVIESGVVQSKDWRQEHER